MTARRTGVLFDMDGTLIDSEPIWHRTIVTFAAERNVLWTFKDAAETTGMPMAHWAGLMRERGVREPVEQIVAETSRRVAETVRRRVPWLPGALELLESLAEHAVPTALVTNAGRVNADALLAAAPAGTLAAAISADDVAQGKPDPEGYLAAARLLDVDTEGSIVFEDSGPSARAARAAGAQVWFLRTHSDSPGFEPDRSFGSLAEVDAEELLAALD